MRSNTGKNIRIGKQANAGIGLDGIIRNVKIHDVALTPEEVAQEYRSGKASLNKNSAFAKEFIEV